MKIKETLEQLQRQEIKFTVDWEYKKYVTTKKNSNGDSVEVPMYRFDFYDDRITLKSFTIDIYKGSLEKELDRMCAIVRIQINKYYKRMVLGETSIDKIDKLLNGMVKSDCKIDRPTPKNYEERLADKRKEAYNEQ